MYFGQQLINQTVSYSSFLQPSSENKQYMKYWCNQIQTLTVMLLLSKRVPAVTTLVLLDSRTCSGLWVTGHTNCVIVGWTNILITEQLFKKGER